MTRVSLGEIDALVEAERERGQARQQLPPDADTAPPPITDLAQARVRRRTIFNDLSANITRQHRPNRVYERVRPVPARR
jgi:hypothetical protein